MSNHTETIIEFIMALIVTCGIIYLVTASKQNELDCMNDINKCNDHYLCKIYKRKCNPPSCFNKLGCRDPRPDEYIYPTGFPWGN